MAEPTPAWGVRETDLFGAAAVVVGAFLLSRATGLLRTVAIGYRFGTEPELAAYLAANRIPEILFQVVVGGAVSSAFIPVLSGYLARADRSGAERMVGSLMTLAVVALAPLCLVLALFAPSVMRLLAPDFAPDQQALAADLARIMLVSPLFFALGTFATSVLNAHQRFALAALAPTAYNLGLIVGALVLAPFLGIYGLAIGGVLGAAAYLLVQLPGLIRVGLRYRPALALDHPGVRRVGALMAPRALGLAATQLNFVALIVLASPMPEAIPALDYAWTLTMLPLGVIAMAISTAVFPTLAAQTARDQLEAMRATLASALRVIVYLTVPAAVGLLVLNEPIVRLLLERGQFTATSTALTVTALRFYALGLIGLAVTEILVRAFYALQDTRTPVALAVGAMLLNVALALLLRPWLGHGGLALAMAIAALAEATALLMLAHRRLKGFDDGRLLGSSLRSLVGGLALAAVLVPLTGAIGAPFESAGLLQRLGLVLLAIAVGCGVYLAATLALRAEEPGRLYTMARRRLG